MNKKIIIYDIYVVLKDACPSNFGAFLLFANIKFLALFKIIFNKVWLELLKCFKSSVRKAIFFIKIFVKTSQSTA